MSAHDIFGALGVEVEETNFSVGDAFQKLKDGEIAAAMVTAGKPSYLLRRLKRSDGYRVVPIPLKSSLIGDYAPSTLEHDDYPDLIPEGQTVDTLASGILIIAYNWPKGSDHYRRLDRFVGSLFPRLAELQTPPRHEKWKDTILAAKVPGWKRFEGAEAWLKNDDQQQPDALRDQLEQVSAGRGPASGAVTSEADRNRIRENFMRWMKRGTQ
jgi:hypothetical protein